jgi:hypothetical protein
LNKHRFFLLHNTIEGFKLGIIHHHAIELMDFFSVQ